MDESLTASSGNVFHDLGFPAEEAVILQMRAELLTDLRKFVSDNNYTQQEVARILGISQSRAGELMHGRWEKFSLEMLITLATRAGIRICLSRAA